MTISEQPDKPPSSPPAAQAARVFDSRRSQRRLKFTREGKFFVGITLGVGFAAINTGNNLLYLLLGLLLALIIVSGVMSELSLRDLTVIRRLPARAQVGKPHLVEIEVINQKKKIPSYAIEVEDLRAGHPADKRCFFLKVSPDANQIAAYRRTPTRRGLDRYVGFRIATRFPFGLFEKSREVQAEGELLVYPAVDPITLSPRAHGKLQGGGRSAARGQGEEFLGMRRHRDGEDLRDVHWRKSAALGQLVVRERTDEKQPEVILHLEQSTGAHADERALFAFEHRVRDVASRAVAHLKRGDVVTVRTKKEAVFADRSTGADRVLRFLALVHPQVDGVSE